jgi:DNA-binding response OmpR family regulator
LPGDLLLIVDDEPNIVALARMYLEREGFQVESVGDGLSALESIYLKKPTLIILDIMLPGLDGLEVCRRLRSDDHPVLIIMLTARDEDIDKILGLEMGADDYMTKPFNPRELVARVKAIIRRTKSRSITEQVEIQVGELTINPGAREISVNGELIKTRTQEFDLLLTLVQHLGLVLTREQILNKAWGYDYAGQTRTVDVHIGHLRKKLVNSNVVIETVTGVGYKISVYLK